MNFTFDSARSFKGRAQLFLIIITVITAVFLLSAESSAHSDGGYIKRNFLRTSYNPEYYSLFEINGNTVGARGKYASDRIQKLYFSGVEDMSGSYKMSVNSDGSYEAEISLPEGYRYVTLCVRLMSGTSFGYRIDYSNSWYFSDNGLSESNKTVFDNITDATPESVGYYLSPTANKDEIASVQEQLKLISDSVVEGIESDYEKAKAITLYVAKHFYYDHDARVESVTEANVSLSEVLKTCRTVCTGFADLYCGLLQAQGIDAVNIKGGSIGGDITYEKLTDGVQNHEFTAFFYEDEQRWVWVDSCWSGSGDYENGEYIDDKSHLKYFDISDEALALTHRADYAQRRNFFNAVAADIPENSTTTTEITTSPSETTVTTAISSLTSAEAPAEVPQSEDNRLLIAIVAVLGVAVIIAGVAVIKLIKNNNP